MAPFEIQNCKISSVTSIRLFYRASFDMYASQRIFFESQHALKIFQLVAKQVMVTSPFYHQQFVYLLNTQNVLYMHLD